MWSLRQLLIGALAVLILAGGGIGALKWYRSRQAAVLPPAPAVATSTKQVIGYSVQGRAIESYTFGTGATNLLFVGGVHGGYEWNSVLLAYAVIDYLNASPGVVPANVSVTVVPNLNPDGVYKVVGKEGRFAAGDVPADKVVRAAGRFNSRAVDLNRNFDCKWQATSTWQGREVSAGTAAFSEPEAAALRNLVLKIKPKAAVFWHSQAGAVYASECEQGILPATLTLMSTYAQAADYPAVKTFDAYAITGDAEGWLASLGIPAITVEFKTHDSPDLPQNLAGVKAVLNLYRP